MSKIVIRLSALCLFFVWASQTSAATITINSGSSLIISGGQLDLDCDDIQVVVNNGGSLSITGGVVSDLNVQVKAGGNYSRTGGNVTECDSFYIITTPNGTAIINL